MAAGDVATATDGVIDILAADAAVAALTGSGARIYGWRLPPTIIASMPTDAVVVAPSGGPASGTGAGDHARVTDARVDVRCYGSTPRSADVLAGRVVEALKAWGRSTSRTTSSGVRVLSIRRDGGTVAIVDPDTDWTVAVAPFRVLHADVLI